MHPIRQKFLICSLALCVLPALANTAVAAPAQPTGTVVVAQNDGPSLGEAVEQVRRQYRGRIVSAATEVRGNREVHVIKVLTEDGKVKTVRIPGRSRGNRT
ncbi:MAG: hypothetical protein WBM54_01930 [Woeseia sp.]